MNNSQKIYPQVDDVPDNVKKEWLNNAPQTTYNLTLSAEQFDALYELLDETIVDISSDLDLDLVDLNDIEIYQVFQQMKRFREGN